MTDQVAQSKEEWGLQKLPLELRLRIWEATWPATRLIEVRLPPGRTIAPRRTKPSTQVGAEKVTAWNSQSHHLESIACPSAYTHPIALRVCREARAHTLKTYTRLQHAHVADCVFYFDPRRDVLWLHRDLSQFNMAGGLSHARRVLFKDVERSDDSDADRKQRRRELLELVESMGAVREVMVLAHWTSIGDLDSAKSDPTLYDWMQYFMSILDENWEITDGHSWVLQFLSTWGELGVCFEGGDARVWGEAREGPLYSCPSHDVVYRKRLVERFPKRFVDISRISS